MCVHWCTQIVYIKYKYLFLFGIFCSYFHQKWFYLLVSTSSSWINHFIFLSFLSWFAHCSQDCHSYTDCLVNIRTFDYMNEEKKFLGGSSSRKIIAEVFVKTDCCIRNEYANFDEETKICQKYFHIVVRIQREPMKK